MKKKIGIAVAAVVVVAGAGVGIWHHMKSETDLEAHRQMRCLWTRLEPLPDLQGLTDYSAVIPVW